MLQIVDQSTLGMYVEGDLRWGIDFLDLAQTWANVRSKDPSTKVGAVIARRDHTIVSIGYNGFPRGYPDDFELYADRAMKYPRVVHAEMNAVATAREPLDSSHTLYCPLIPCSECTKNLIQFGIHRVVCWLPNHETAELHNRWKDSFGVTEELLEKCNGFLTLIDRNIRPLVGR